MGNQSLEKEIIKMAKAAKEASYQLALVSTPAKNQALGKMANRLLAKKAYIIKKNKKDLAAAAQQNYSKALIDRLMLNEKRINEMAACLLDTAKLKDPVGQVLKTIKRPNGLVIKKVRTPIGVVGIIYESRPNVTSDCIGLCLKSGNAVILKGGKEAAHSNKVIFSVLRDSLKQTEIPAESLQLISSTDRQ